jgi:hypothetical protein
MSCVDSGTFERPPLPGLRYVAFTDPSGGASDSFTIAVAHKDADTLFLDCIREVRPPFSPEAVIGEFAQLCKTYRINKVVGDRYAGEFPRELFRKFGISYELSAAPKSDLYRDTLPLINSRRVALLDHNKMVNQFIGLERRTARSGRDSIDHAPGAKDDICNAVAGALTASAVRRLGTRSFTIGGAPGAVGGHPIPLRAVHPVEQPRHDPLAPGPHNDCIPGKGINSQPSRPQRRNTTSNTAFGGRHD